MVVKGLWWFGWIRPQRGREREMEEEGGEGEGVGEGGGDLMIAPSALRTCN